MTSWWESWSCKFLLVELMLFVLDRFYKSFWNVLKHHNFSLKSEKKTDAYRIFYPSRFAFPRDVLDLFFFPSYYKKNSHWYYSLFSCYPKPLGHYLFYSVDDNDGFFFFRDRSTRARFSLFECLRDRNASKLESFQTEHYLYRKKNKFLYGGKFSENPKM